MTDDTVMWRCVECGLKQEMPKFVRPGLHYANGRPKRGVENVCKGVSYMLDGSTKENRNDR